MKTLLLETKYEFLKLLRYPGFAVPVLCFPLIFYLMFGIGLAKHDAQGVTVAKYLLATYGSFGVIAASLFGFGVTIAQERGFGWLEVKRTTPMPIAVYFVSKMLMAMLFSAIVILLLFAAGTLIAGVRMPLGSAAELFAILVAGSVPFSALGLAIGTFASPTSAPPIINVIYMPISFLSGLWIPIFALPKAIRGFAVVLPPYHLSQLALHAIGSGGMTPNAVHAAAMAVSTALALVLAYFGFRRGEAKMI